MNRRSLTDEGVVTACFHEIDKECLSNEKFFKGLVQLNTHCVKCGTFIEAGRVKSKVSIWPKVSWTLVKEAL